MYPMKRIVLITFLVFFQIQVIQPQEKSTSISLEDVLTSVKKNNRGIKVSEQELHSVKAEFNQTKAVFLPNITVSHTGVSTTNPLMAFGSKLNQGIITQNHFNPAELNNPSAIQNFTTKATIEQPLINIDGFYQRKAAKSKLKATEFKTKRAKEYILFEAEKAYYQLQFAYKTIEILKTIQEAIVENKRLIDAYYKQGLLQKSDVLALEVRVLEIESQLQFAKSNLKNASNYVSFFMGDQTQKMLKPKSTLALKSLSTNSQKLSENRADIKALKAVSNSYKVLYQSQQRSYLPTLNAFGSYEINSNKLLTGGTSGYLVGFQLNWKLFQGFKRIGANQKSKALYKKSEIELQEHLFKSKLNYQKTQRNLIDIQHKLELSKKAMLQSKEALRIKKNRFKQGLEKTSDLLQSEALYAQKVLDFNQTILEYNNAQSYLIFLIKE